MERGRFASKACVDFAVHHSFKGKCFINWYWDVSGCMLHTLKGFYMAKSAQNLNMNRVLSKCEFVGVAAFANIMLGIRKLVLSHVFASICRSYVQKCNTFKVCCRQNTIL